MPDWFNKIKPKLSVVDKSSTVDSMQQNYVENYNYLIKNKEYYMLVAE